MTLLRETNSEAIGVSSCGWLGVSIKHSVTRFSRRSENYTHWHPLGLRGRKHFCVGILVVRYGCASASRGHPSENVVYAAGLLVCGAVWADQASILVSTIFEAWEHRDVLD